MWFLTAWNQPNDTTSFTHLFTTWKYLIYKFHLHVSYVESNEYPKTVIVVQVISLNFYRIKQINVKYAGLPRWQQNYKNILPAFKYTFSKLLHISTYVTCLVMNTPSSPKTIHINTFTVLFLADLVSGFAIVQHIALLHRGWMWMLICHAINKLTDFQKVMVLIKWQRSSSRISTWHG